MSPARLNGFKSELEKIALRALTKHLMKKAPAARAAALKALPAPLRSQEAYKQLGHQAAGMVKRMPGDAGHGAQHVFNVTRNTQRLLQNQPVSVRRRGTLGALIHDVGREAEGTVKKRIGREAFRQTPSAWHSELGGRYAKNFLQQNRQVAQYVPGLTKGRLSGVVRAHDTDIHSVKPWTRQTLARDPAAAMTYTGDKMEGMGRIGAERTVQMAQKFKEPVAETMGVAQKNLGKYQALAQQPYIGPAQRQILQPQISEYQRLMQHYGQHGALPAAPIQKAAMAVGDIHRILERGLRSAQDFRTLRNLAKHSPSVEGDIATAVFKLPQAKRYDIITQLADKLNYVLGRTVK